MRHWFTACLLACALAATGFTSQPSVTHVLDNDARGLEHVLNRVGYGPDVWSLDRIVELGVTDYITEQLHPHSIDDSDFEARIADLIAVQMSWRELQESYCHATCTLGSQTEARRQLSEAKILRSIYSRRQLEAVLFDFWFDHFNIDASHGQLRIAAIPFERDVIQPHVLGRFSDMLIAVAKSPAMLDYLDNSRNTAGKINENYARELLELHTVGVDGGYDQSDVESVARVMTGWRLIPSLRAFLQVGGMFGSVDWSLQRYFRFVEEDHDVLPKLVMDDLELRNSGAYEGLELLSYLARHPKTAERISRLLIERFVSEDAPEPLVTEAAGTFTATDGDLRAVMETILLSPEFARGHIREKVKRPLVFVASLIRATRVDIQAGSTQARGLVVHLLNAMGEPLYRAKPPTGYSDASETWASPGGLLQRFRLIDVSHLGDRIGAGATPGQTVDSLIGRYLPGGASLQSRHVVLAFLEQGDPTDPRRIRTAASLILSSPEFMRH